MSLQPAVSICLTAYKRAQVIGKTIESLLAQTLGDFELIITDDASPDDTEAVCRAYAKLDRRIRYVRQRRNVGMPANLNTGLSMAAAPLVANLHDGDIYRPDLLDRWKRALDEQPDAAFVFNSYELLNEGGEVRGLMSSGLPRRFERSDLVRYMLEPVRCYRSPVWGTVMGRAHCYAEVGGFDPHFGFVSDVALWLRLNVRFPVAYVDNPLIKLHQREADRPAAFTNWALVKANVEAYREAGAALCPPDNHHAVQRRLRRIQERHWLLAFASCLRHERFDRAEDGLAAFAEEHSMLLVGAGYAGRPVLQLARCSPLFRSVIRSGSWAYRKAAGR